MKLNGNDLPKLIGFDVENKLTLPLAKASFLFTLTSCGNFSSSDHRLALLNANHENVLHAALLKSATDDAIHFL